MAIEGKLTAGVLATGQNKFGSSLSVTDDGNTLLVGMPQPVLYLNQEPGAGQGAVLVYNKGNATINGITYNTWPTTQTLTSGDQDYEFFNYGYATATDSTANLVAVGSRYATVSNVKFAGQVAMYTKDTNSNLVLSGNIITSNTPKRNARFGSSVAVSGDGNIMIVGAPGSSSNNKSNVGSAHLFFQTAPNVWQEQSVTFDANTDKAGNIFFGNCVAMSNSGDVIAIGAPGIDSDNNQNIGGVYVFSYEAKTEFHGNITGNVLAVANITDSANYSVTLGQYVSGTGVTLGTKVVSQLTSTSNGANVVLSGYFGSNTITITSNVTSISVGYGVTCNTPGIIASSTTVTGIIGNTVTLSSPLQADAFHANGVGIPMVFEHTYVSTVATPIDTANNTVIVSDFSNIKVGQFTDLNNSRVTKISYHNITLDATPVGTPHAVQFLNIGKTGTYEVTPNATTGANVVLNSFGWRTNSVKLKTPKEINEGHFGDSISISGDGNTIVVGSSNGAFVFDNMGTLKSQLVPNGYRDGEAFGSSVAINRDGNMIVVAAPDKPITVVDARQVYTDGRHKFLYEISTKGDANWDSLGITKCTFEIKGTWHSNADGSDYIEVANLTPANVGRLTPGSFIIGANIPEGTTIKTQALPKDTAKWGSNGTYVVNVPAGNTLPIVSNANVSTTIANVIAATISNLANISEGTQFVALANANASTGNGKAISYNIVGTPNSGAIYKFTSSDSGNTWQQTRTMVVESNDTQWNKLGQQLAISNDGHTVFASSTGTEQFGRTNEGLVYVFNI